MGDAHQRAAEGRLIHDLRFQLHTVTSGNKKILQAIAGKIATHKRGCTAVHPNPMSDFADLSVPSLKIFCSCALYTMPSENASIFFGDKKSLRREAGEILV
jgi:hypothetical protein